MGIDREPKKGREEEGLTCITACFLISSSYSESNILYLLLPRRQMASPAETVCCCSCLCLSESLD